MITVLIADDQAVVRAGLRMILEAQDDITVTGEAADGAAAVEVARELRPDVVLMDIRMPVLDGIAATREIAGSELSTRVLVLTTYGVDDNVYDALEAGAAGFLVKTDPPERLTAAIRAVADGETPLAPEIVRLLIERYLTGRSPEPKDAGLDELTARELEVLTLIARGHSNAEIASRLYVSEGTVKTHVARILAKLELRDRTQAAIHAYESGLIQPRQQ